MNGDSRPRWRQLALGLRRTDAPAAEPAPEPPRRIDQLAGPLDDLAELVLGQAQSGVLAINRRGCVVRTNQALQRMCGGSPHAQAGRQALLLFAQAERDQLWARLQAVLLGQAAEQAVLANLERHGAEGALAVEISLAPVREEDGSISGLLMRLKDVTAQRQLEAQLAQSQKLQAVGQLAAGIAHDFNNLLTAILGAADMIAAREGLDEATREDAALVRASAERGGGLVRHLLAFGRQQALQPQVIRVDEAIRAVTALLGRLLGSKITLELDLTVPEGLARVDPTQFDQVLVNLAVNARDAMEAGGTLTIRSGHITLHRPLVRGREWVPPGRYVMVEVQDTGCGIAPDLLPRIFDPFMTTKRDSGGTGLGLSTVHGIIRQSDGFLGVESEPGIGTRLRVYLPRHAAAGATAIPPPPVDLPVNVSRCVLLVDDEPLVLRLAERAFRQAGWAVIGAADGEAAAEQARKAGRLDLVVSDVMMPGLDGLGLVRRLRERWPALPAILVSGYANEDVRRDLNRTEMKFLPKPYRLSDLIQLANTVAGAES